MTLVYLPTNMQSLTTISPIDGRYKNETNELRNFFSEYAFLRYCVYLEILYLIALGEEKEIKELQSFDEKEKKALEEIFKTFGLEDARRIKEIENTTHHDIKAIEYFLREKLAKINLAHAISFIHFGLTSDDIKNLAYVLGWKHAVHGVYITELTSLLESLENKIVLYKDIPLLSLTHGQPATPTTLGKEIHVYAYRLSLQMEKLEEHKLYGKFGGAVGTWSAHAIAYPQIDWKNFGSNFLMSLGLVRELVTTQVNSYDSLAESFNIVSRINTILTDLSRDMWLYISREVFVQKNKELEIGSSTMPHKINPIYFENAEGNLGIANGYLAHLSQTLPISRMQRDLSGSTAIRNQGVPLAHSLIAIKNIIKGLERIEPNEDKIKEELKNHPEVLTEAIATILRKYGKEDAYETLKEMSRGKAINKDTIHKFIEGLDIPKEDKIMLLELKPKHYRGLY